MMRAEDFANTPVPPTGSIEDAVYDAIERAGVCNHPSEYKVLTTAIMEGVGAYMASLTMPELRTLASQLAFAAMVSHRSHMTVRDMSLFRDVHQVFGAVTPGPSKDAIK